MMRNILIVIILSFVIAACCAGCQPAETTGATSMSAQGYNFSVIEYTLGDGTECAIAQVGSNSISIDCNW